MVVRCELLSEPRLVNRLRSVDFDDDPSVEYPRQHIVSYIKNSNRLIIRGVMRWANFMQYIDCIIVPRLWYLASSNDVTADVRNQLSGLVSCMLYDLGSDIFCILAFAIL